jgi:flagellar biosynthesis/type III secretory pathway protein FliH
MVADEVIQGISDSRYKLGYVLSSSVENSPKNVSQTLQEALSVEQHWSGNTQIPVHPHNVQHINILCNKNSKTKSVSRTLEFVQSVGLLNA